MKDNRKTIKKDVEAVAVTCQEYLDYIKTFGNPCAYSDRIVEEIIEKAKKLEKDYQEQFKED